MEANGIELLNHESFERFKHMVKRFGGCNKLSKKCMAKVRYEFYNTQRRLSPAEHTEGIRYTEKVLELLRTSYIHPIGLKCDGEGFWTMYVNLLRHPNLQGYAFRIRQNPVRITVSESKSDRVLFILKYMNRNKRSDIETAVAETLSVMDIIHNRGGVNYWNVYDRTSNLCLEKVSNIAEILPYINWKENMARVLKEHKNSTLLIK
jgi:hypothetical protein